MINNTWKKGLFPFVFSALALISCGQSTEETTDGSSGSSVETAGNPSEALSASINEVSKTMASTVSMSGGASLTKALAFRSVGCFSDGSDVNLSVDCSDDTHTMTVDRTMTDCETADGEMTVTGTDHVEWTNMGTGTCGQATHEDRFWAGVQGQGEGLEAIFIQSTDPDTPTDPATSITRTITEDGRSIAITGFRATTFSDYSETQNESLETVQTVTGDVLIEASHVGTSSEGTTVFNFDVFTDNPDTTDATETLTVNFEDVDGDYTRTIESGTIYTQRNLLGQTIAQTFDNVVWNPTGELGCDCNPISGTVSISVTDNDTDEVVGTGSIEFTAAETGVCDSANVTYDGSEINMPLRNCE